MTTNRYQSAGVLPVGYEAKCVACGCTFNPSGEEQIRLDGRVRGGGRVFVEHYCDDNGNACGAFGEVLGGWTTMADMNRRVIPLEEARGLTFAPNATCYGCLGTGAVQGFGHTGDRCHCTLHETGECEPDSCSAECKRREELREEAEAAYAQYGTVSVDVALVDRIVRTLGGA